MKHVAIFGNDSNSGLNVIHALRSVQPAIITGEYEATVYGGLYSETLITTSSETSIKGVGEVVFKESSPNQTFLDSASKGIRLENIVILRFLNAVDGRTNSVVRFSSIKKCKLYGDNTNLLIYNFQASSNMHRLDLEDTLIVNYDLVRIDLGRMKGVTLKCNTLLIDRVDEFSSYIQDCIIDAGEIRILSEPFKIANVLFSSSTLFTYSDGVNSVDKVDFATFQLSNNSYNWGFSFHGVEIEEPINTFIDPDNEDFKLKSQSIASSMSSKNSHVGMMGIGYGVSVTDIGWNDSSNFIFNSNQYEATTDASIRSPVLDLLTNKIIKGFDGLIKDDWLNGLLFNSTGNLALTALISGGDQYELNVVLEDESVFFVNGYLEVETSDRTFTSADAFSFTSGLNEQIISVTGNGSIRKVEHLSGKRTILVKIWKEGSFVPANYKPFFIDDIWLLDVNGNSNAETTYTGVSAHAPCGRYIEFKPVVTALNVKS